VSLFDTLSFDRMLWGVVQSGWNGAPTCFADELSVTSSTIQHRIFARNVDTVDPLWGNTKFPTKPTVVFKLDEENMLQFLSVDELNQYLSPSTAGY